LGFIVCAYGLAKQARPSRPAFGLPGAHVAHGGRLITVWTPPTGPKTKGAPDARPKGLLLLLLLLVVLVLLLLL
jgi:hypothetical protein